jgi:cephalosporin-C deacetylase
MKNIKLWLFFYFAFLNLSLAQKIDFTQNWRFKKGDDTSFAKTTFDDCRWQPIKIGEIWENELKEPTYDGFGWYRWQGIIPSKMKKQAEKHGGFVMHLGKIDDADQTFFNGTKIGQTGDFPPRDASAWDVSRQYIVPLALINWDKMNTVAVRVYDSGGGGGLYGGDYSLEPLSWRDKVSIDIEYLFNNNELPENQPFTANINFKNDIAENIKGTVFCEIKTYSGKNISNIKIEKKIAGLKNNTLNVKFDGLERGFYALHVTFESKKGYKIKSKKGLAVAPTALISPPTPSPDFDAFWENTKADLAKIAPDFKVTPSPEWSNDKQQTFLISMQSLDNVQVSGWYTVPKGKKNLIGLLKVQGYGTVMLPDTTLQDMAVFALNIRGHGNSRKDINPGFPGYLFAGIEQPEKYIYRGAYMDCLRALDFLATRQEVNHQRIVVEGGSQGGALSFATAALDRRVKLCLPDVPFLSDFPTYFQIATWPAEEFTAYQKNTNRPWKEIYQLLNYFDIKNLAPKITCPVKMSIGLFDDICPPMINFAAYNNLKIKEKMYLLYPNAYHALPSTHSKLKMNWIRDFFNAE